MLEKIGLFFYLDTKKIVSKKAILVMKMWKRITPRTLLLGVILNFKGCRILDCFEGYLIFFKSWTGMADTMIKIKFIFHLRTIVICNQKFFKIKYHA